MQSIVGRASGSTMRVCVFCEQRIQQNLPALIEMDTLEVCERMGATVHGVLVDQLSPAKESSCKAGAKYVEGKLGDWKKTLRSVTFKSPSFSSIGHFGSRK